jgi:hypothetical protein
MESRRIEGTALRVKGPFSSVFPPQGDIAMRALILVLLDPLYVTGICFAENVNRIGTNVLATFFFQRV